jgi:hypothetical protein
MEASERTRDTLRNKIYRQLLWMAVCNGMKPQRILDTHLAIARIELWIRAHLKKGIARHEN